MRITIETTNSEPQYSVKSIIEVPYDDVTITELLTDLIGPAIVGMGYSADNVKEFIGEEGDTDNPEGN